MDLCETIISDGTAKILLKIHDHNDYVKDNYIKTAAVNKLFDDLKTEIRLAHAAQNAKFDSLLDMMHQMLMRDHNARSADK